jgi:hypothetical protein
LSNMETKMRDILFVIEQVICAHDTKLFKVKSKFFLFPLLFYSLATLSSSPNITVLAYS